MSGYAADDGRDARLARFDRQPITWHSCRRNRNDDIGKTLDAAGARCAEVTVPVDYSAPDGRTTTVAISRRKASDRARRLGTLMINTGGPSESLSGVTWVLQGLPPFAVGSPQLAKRYDLVGMDPRFMGRNPPLACGWPTGLAEKAAFVGLDRASFDRSVALTRKLAARCAGQKDLLPHVSTRNIARDLDVIRAVLGERKVSYLGWSYGGYLGGVYLQMFPDRVDRMLLDSPPDPDTYGADGARDNAPALAAEQRNWAAWAARHDDRYHLGATTAQVLASMDVIRRVADRGRPVRIGRHRADLNLVRRLALGTDAEWTYARWSDMMRLLYDAARGVKVTPTPAQEEVLAILSSTEVNTEAAASAASRCADRASSSRDPEVYYRDIQAHRAGEPFFGPPNRNVTPCTFWPAEPAEPPTTIRNGRPVLIVGASGDPGTPYAGQLVMHRALTGSRMLTLRGAYRHGVTFFEGNPCVDRVANRYLLTGVLPGTDITCSRVSPYPGASGSGETPTKD
ncbi:alpha/beta hydrolase [Planomonospora sp. ID67723]|uniref:alpha/beta hydrolase n=1 Tax=Planomonospora sp. ID67723 TaxID=2738134 RepID=UPI001E2AF6FF|nr:alpha/beta hydrolase [Planomonospora sp. ID67723]